jgi:hypothetical protein
MDIPVRLVPCLGVRMDQFSRLQLRRIHDRGLAWWALDRTQPGLPMKPGRAGTMTHDYSAIGPRRCSPPSTAPSSAATCSSTGTRSSSASSTPSRGKCQSERRSIRSSTTMQLTSAQSAQMARATSSLVVPLHTGLRILAQCRQRLHCQGHATAPPPWRVPIRRRP